MTKLQKPLLSISARGSLADTLLFDNRKGQPRVRKKPAYTYSRTLAQQYQRWVYQDAGFYWAAISDAARNAFRTDASRYHLPRYAAFLRWYLRNLPDLAAAWHLDEHAGNQVEDSSPNNNHGIAFGALPTPGRIGNAKSFDGVDDRIQVPDAPSLRLVSDLTIEAFVTCTEDTGSLQTIVGKSPFNAFREFGFSIRPGLARLEYGDDDETDWSPLFPYTIGSTIHVAMTRNRAMKLIKYYVEGAYIGYNDYLTHPPISTEDIFIGTKRFVNWPYEGDIDHLFLWSRLLSEEQILNHSLRRYP